MNKDYGAQGDGKLLKSDYFRIEMVEDVEAGTVAAGLKSDYFRIEISKDYCPYNWEYNAKIRLF